MRGDPPWLAEQGRPARRQLRFTLALGELAGILLIVQTGLLVAIGNGAIIEGRGPRELAPFFGGLLGSIALRAALAWASKRSAFECASLVKRKLRRDLIEGLRSIGPLALAAMHTGETAGVLVEAVESIEGYYAGYLPQRAIATLLPFTVLAVVFPLDWLSGLVLVLTAVFLPLSMIVIGEESHARNQRLWATLARLGGRFLDALRGLVTVKLFGAERRELFQIERSSEDYRAATMSVLRIAFLSSFMLEFVTAVSIAIVAVLTGLRLLSGGMRFTPGYFILLIAPDFFLTLRSLGTQYHARMEAASAAEHLQALMDRMSPGGRGGSRADHGPGPGSGAGATERPAEKTSVAANRAGDAEAATVEFREVSFSHGSRPVLENLSFALEKGERLALIGPSGSGKSTILALLLGFATPRSGSILLDGRDLEGYSRDELCELIAWLPQRPTLFHGSLGSNIALGRPGATEAEIGRAAELARVDEFASGLEAGLGTIVGEGGRSLSAGQAQRVALARLFLRRPKLILLDEPTAHLDPRSEELVNASLAELCRGRTSLTVTHRPPVAADRSLRIASLAARAAG